MTSDSGNRPHPDRRRFLIGAAAFSTPFILPGIANAAIGPQVRTVALHNMHTGEKVKTAYWEKGRYINDALGEINVVLRDFRTDEVYPIDVRVIDLLQSLRRKLGTNAPYRVVSGYRSPKTNAALAAKSGGVAKKSLHMQGMAIDMSLPDRDLRTVHKVAKSLKLGGVGYYPKSGFVHVDVGKVRYW